MYKKKKKKGFAELTRAARKDTLQIYIGRYKYMATTSLMSSATCIIQIIDLLAWSEKNFKGRAPALLALGFFFKSAGFDV